LTDDHAQKGRTQVVDKERTDQRFREDLEDLSAAWERAMISNDAAAIGSFMSDDWVIVSATGVTKRDDFLAVVASGDLGHETFKGEIISVRQYGAAAVVTSRVRNNGHYRGKAFSADEWTTDVFVHRNGNWRCVHSHITTVKEA
jgi:ketosteroid isomerase-like protein